jgi:hypothetical protein
MKSAMQVEAVPQREIGSKFSLARQLLNFFEDSCTGERLKRLPPAWLRQSDIETRRHSADSSLL